MHEYVDNILEKKIALVSLATIMVLTGVTFGIGFAFQKRPQLLKGKYETSDNGSIFSDCNVQGRQTRWCH